MGLNGIERTTIGISWNSSQQKLGFSWDFHWISPTNPPFLLVPSASEDGGAKTELQVSQATTSAELGEMPALEVEMAQ